MRCIDVILRLCCIINDRTLSSQKGNAEKQDFQLHRSPLVTKIRKCSFRHIILPSIALSSIMLPLFIRLIRAEMVEVLQTEYVKFAHAKGLNPTRVLMVHAFKNTLLPVITVGGVQLGIMIAYTILTETVFQWQGMGFMFIEAVERSDTALLVAYLVFVGVLFVIVNTVVDVIYGLVNPMVRVSGRK